jgi:hypothetical protein
VRLQQGDTVLEQPLQVTWDPVNRYDAQAIAEQQAFLAETWGMIDALYRRLGSLLSLQKQVELRKTLASEAGDDASAEAAEALLDALSTWQRSVSTPDRETFQDVLNFAPRIDTFLINVYQQADSAVLGLTRGQRERLQDLRPDWQAAIEAWDALLAGPVAQFNASAGPAVVIPGWE